MNKKNTTKKGTSFLVLLLIAIGAIGLTLYYIGTDGRYIITGNTENLNEILLNDRRMPDDQYVTYECAYPLGSYSSTKHWYVIGFIPIPFGTDEHIAVYTENNKIITITASNKELINQLNYSDGSVTVTGKVGTIDYETKDYLEEVFEGSQEGRDILASGIDLTSYEIDTTATRLSQLGKILFLVAMDVLFIYVIICERKNKASKK